MSVPRRTSDAVLVIDAQVDLIQGDKPVYNGSAVVARIRSLTERARQAGVLVIYLLDKDVAPPDSPGWQLDPGLHARDDDPRIRKDYSDSFHHTDLDDQLQQRGVTRVIVCGCTTDACVDLTARRAVSLGYDVVLASDAHTTTDNSFLSAQQSIAYYNRMLDGFGAEDGFGNGEHEIVTKPCFEIDFA
jgi:nicotinamidase-related amidase